MPVNSNPAPIMTDTTIADKVYTEPRTMEYVLASSAMSARFHKISTIDA